MTVPNSGYTIFHNIAKEQRQRIAAIFAKVIILTGILISFAILYLAVTTREQHIFILYGGNLLFLVMVYIGLRQIQKENINTGILLLTGSIQLIIVLLPVLFKDLGVVIGLISFLMAFMITSQTLETNIIRKVIPLCALAGIVTAVVDYLPLPFRIPAPSSLIITIALISILEATILIVIVWLQFKTYNIQTKLIVSFITLLVISLMVTGGYNVAVNYGIQQSQLSTSLENDLNAKRTAIDEFLEAARDDTIFLSQAEVLRNYIQTLDDLAAPDTVTQARTVVEREFRSFAENRGDYEQIRFLNNAGEEDIRINTDGDGNSAIVQQSELRKKDAPYSFRESTYFTQSNQLSAGEIFVSPLDLERGENQIKIPYEPIIRLGTPVVINTQTKGVILISVYAKELLNTLSAPNSNSFLVDANGYYLYHPDESKRWGQDLGTGITINNDFPDLVNDLYSGKPGSREIGGYLITYTPITIPGESAPRWYLGNFVTLDSSIRPILTSIFTSLTLLLLTMVASIFAVTYLSGTITAPLGKLAIIAQDIANGNLSARANIETKDEVGTLARVFNDMTGQLQELVIGLEARVGERTIELEKERQRSDTRAKQFEAITKVARAISTTRNLQELLPQISRVISEQFGFYHVGIFLNDFTNQVATLSAANSEGGQKMLARGHQLKVGEQGIVGFVTGTGQPRIALDVGDDIVFFNNPDLPNTRSEMALPLMIADKIIGALDVQSTESNAFSNEDIGVLSTLADQVSVAIQNARLFDQTSKALAGSEAISRQYLRESWGRLSSEHKLTGFRYTASGASPLERDLATNNAKAQSAAKISDERPHVKIPIQLRGETIGTLKVNAPETGKLTDIQLDLMKAVAERVALSVENARLFEETAKRAERERRVSDITTKIRSANDPQQMIDTAIEELRQALGATFVEVVPQRLSDKTDK
jgi:GAF domain-containing protein/HAMP domain-containing protein